MTTTTQQPVNAQTRWQRVWGPIRSVLSTLMLTALMMGGMAVLMARGPSEVPAPSFTAKTVEGAEVRVGGDSGKPVVLYFWASWCSACKITSPIVSNYAARHPDVRVIGVAVDEVDTIRAALADSPRAFTTVIDDGKIAQKYGVSAFPTTFTLDSQGRPSWSRQGVLMPGELDVRGP